ncbi:MAG: MerR family transcriptional regulator [Myxococcota bacterium]
MYKARAEETAGLYPMRMVTQLTGLSADTIRAWERRHGAVTPSRSAGNTRRFTADEVRRLVLLREATEGGHSIRSIAPLDVGELERLVDQREVPLHVVSDSQNASPGSGLRALCQAYLGALARFDTRRAFDLLMRGATFLDRKMFVFEVVLPIYREVKDRWSQPPLGSSQENVFGGQLRAVLMTLLRLSPPATGSPRLLMTTIEGHSEENRLLVAALLATAMAYDPVFIGPSRPNPEIEWAVRMSRADVLVLSARWEFTPDDLNRFTELSDHLRPGVEVWCGLRARHPLISAVPMDVFFHDYGRFLDALQGLSRIKMRP